MNSAEKTQAEIAGRALLERLGSGIGVQRALHLAVTESTNLVARDWARTGDAADLLVLADGQSAGRGRLGRSFLSPEGEGLWFSRVMRPAAGQPVAPAMTLVAGVAACQALRALGVTEAVLKWPNDILIDGRKTAGILAEASTDSAGRPFLVLGIGINLDIREFPPELAAVATSVRGSTGVSIDRISLLREILQRLDRLGRQLAAGGFAAVRPEYLALSATVGREVLLIDPAAAGALPADGGVAAGGQAPQVARCIDIDEDGALVLVGTDGRVFRRNAGEVSLRDPAAARRRA